MMRFESHKNIGISHCRQWKYILFYPGEIVSYDLQSSI